MVVLFLAFLVHMNDVSHKQKFQTWFSEEKANSPQNLMHVLHVLISSISEFRSLSHVSKTQLRLHFP